jgi:predicted nucleotide-binding protein
MPRRAGTPNRNYPPITLRDALGMARAIYEGASGMPVDRLTLSELLDRSPSSSLFITLVLASRAYGLTSGGKNAEEFALTAIGREAVAGDEATRLQALRKAVMNIEPFRIFFTAYDKKKVPVAAPFKAFLTSKAGVTPERADEAMAHLLDDAQIAGLLRTVKGASYVDLQGAPPVSSLAEDDGVEPGDEDEGFATAMTADEPRVAAADGNGASSEPAAPLAPRKVFIAHGKNHTPLNQLKKALDQFRVRYAVAVDEPHQGRPISQKVAKLMQEECSSAIFIFTADEKFLSGRKDGGTEEVWRPSENVVFELGAASVLYENRIVIFKEKGVTFPSDFSDLGYIEFEQDQLVAELGTLFQELVALDILEVRAKA